LNRLLPLCRPGRSIDLLLRANLSPERDAAKAWQEWLRTRRLEHAIWPEIRLLAPLARRIPTIDPSFPERTRLEGLAKSHWTRTHLMMTESAPALDALKDAGIDFMLFKGAALYAENLHRRRIMADVDVLVAPTAVVSASRSLMDAGWADKNPEARKPFNERVEKFVATGYAKGTFGSVDVHRRVFHFCRRDAVLDAELWRRAQPAEFVGREVLVPTREDSLVIGIAHGVTGREGDWALDAAWRIESGPIEWGRVVEIAQRRGLVPFALAGLSYLEELGCEVPSDALQELRQSRPTLGEYLKYLDEAFVRALRARLPKPLRLGWRWILRRGGRLLLPRHSP
jgi:hypothetical protein